MTDQILVCPICKAALPRSASMSRAGSAIKIDCPNCGDYGLSGAFHSDFIASKQLKPFELATLSHAIRRMQGDGRRPLIVADFARDILRSTMLPTAPEQLDNLILFLGQTLPEPGQKRNLSPNTMRAQLGSMTSESSQWIMRKAIERGLMEGTIHSTISAPYDEPVLNATLSIGGWERFSELQSEASGTKRAFMAMRYGDTEMDHVFFECFKPAAKRAGYDLVKLDEKPRAGLIDDRLRLDIRTARFLVADLSHANKGAYWEAGYAEGLGRPVIYTCKKSVFESDDPELKPHFDTNHYLIVLWDPETLEHAAEQLTTIIRVTLPSEARLSDS